LSGKARVCGNSVATDRPSLATTKTLGGLEEQGMKEVRPGSGHRLVYTGR
jgi:hypothetical protein